MQESFQAAYAAFEPALPQYSSSALPGTGGGYAAAVAGPEGNKYDPKPADKFGDQALAGKVGRGVGRVGFGGGGRCGAALLAIQYDPGPVGIFRDQPLAGEVGCPRMRPRSWALARTP